MTEKNNYYQDDLEETSFDEDDYTEAENDGSYDEEEHFEWWFRYGQK